MPQRPSDPPEELLADRPEDLYENAPCGYLATREDGTLLRVNRTFERLTGLRREDLVGKVRFQDLLAAGDRIYMETHFRPLLQMQESVREIALELRCSDGRLLPVLVNATLQRGEGGGPAVVRTTLFDASDRRAYERELLEARRRAERLQRHNALQAEASRVLDAPRTVAARAGAITELLAKEMAGGAVLRLRDEDEPSAWAGRADDPALLGALDVALRTERAHAPDGAAAAVPLHVHGQCLGALAVTPRGPGSTLSSEDLSLLEAVGARTAVAIDNALLYERERAVALTLQRSMLPTDAPSDPRCEVGTHYAAAVDSLEIGGDFFDAFSIDDDSIAIAVGDVVGKGLRAAATMGQLRSAYRSLALSGYGPRETLEHLDAFVDHTEHARGATVAVAVVDLAGGTATIACAGHPPPVLHRPGEAPGLVWDGRSAPLGAYFHNGERHETTVPLTRGSRVLLYTDGLVERRDQLIDRGIDRLVEAFGRLVDEPVATIGETLTEELIPEGHAADDVCSLTFLLSGPPGFRSLLSADLSQLAALRQDLREWLDTCGVTADHGDAVVLACSEAAANAIEHGLGIDGSGTVRVEAAVSEEAIEIRVRDDGTWREPRQPSERGRGLTIVGSLMDDLQISRDDGTEVRMTLRRSGP